MRELLATYVANRAPEGDPIWLMLVGGSGVGKTERLIPIEVMPDVMLASTITGPAALLVWHRPEGARERRNRRPLAASHRTAACSS